MSNLYKDSRLCGTFGYSYLFNSIEYAINNNKPIAIGKIGSLELRIIQQYYAIINYYLNDFTSSIKDEGANCAGIHPKTSDSFFLFVSKYLKSVANLNILASWNENILYLEEYIWDNYIRLNNVEEDKSIVELVTLESFYTEPQFWWQNLFQHKTILIISPFINSIQTQLDLSKRDKVWSGKWSGFWSPNINFKYIKFLHPYSISSDKDKSTYPMNHTLLMEQYQSIIDNIGGFDIALIGAGGYSLLLCDYIKSKKGKTAFHLGGGLQMMFGVYGNRWINSNNPIIREYINNYWIRPIEEEIPIGYKDQEFGAYF